MSEELDPFSEAGRRLLQKLATGESLSPKEQRLVDESHRREMEFVLDKLTAQASDAAAGITRVTLMADWGAFLWRAHNAGTPSPEDLGLSDALCGRLYRWHHQWERDDTDGAWLDDGRELAAAIAEELGAGAVVDFIAPAHLARP